MKECPSAENLDKFWIKYSNNKNSFHVEPHLKAGKANLLVPEGTLRLEVKVQRPTRQRLDWRWASGVLAQVQAKSGHHGLHVEVGTRPETAH